MKESFTREDLSAIAVKILNKAKETDTKGASVIALSGDLGAGKTTLTQQIGKTLGIKENMVSPTFVIMKIYLLATENYAWKRLIHIDAYRLNKSEELLKLGWNEMKDEKDNLIIVEWPENVPECIDDTLLKIHLSHTDNQKRDIEGL